MKEESVHTCAKITMDTIPFIMRGVVSQIRPTELTMPQFRALMFIGHHEGVSLSIIAEHHGASLSSASKLIDGLVERGYVTRGSSPDDRRRIVLDLTESGRAAAESVHQMSIAYLGEKLSALSAEECATIVSAMHLLRSVFAGEGELP
ncbi:MAG: MarR family winged helix-turn-helix transcriptional regulator [Armatimonadota bacterium]